MVEPVNIEQLKGYNFLVADGNDEELLIRRLDTLDLYRVRFDVTTGGLVYEQLTKKRENY